MSQSNYDIIIIGGGSSGLMTAVVAGLRGRQVLILEKNPELGRKLSITGGGRCNIMNAEPDLRTLLSHYGDASKFLHSAFAIFGPEATRDFFESHGLPLKVEARQRVFPKSERASDVVALFTRLLKESGVVVRTDEGVLEQLHEGNNVIGVRTARGTYTAKNYVIATGGLSHPDTGTTGDGFLWLRTLGHTVHTPNPSLVPLVSADEWAHRLAGTSLAHAGITFKNSGGLVKTSGRILFTHFGLSGPAILNIATKVRHLLKHEPVTATIDLFPGIDDAVLQDNVEQVFRAHSNKNLRNVLKLLVPSGLSTAVAFLLPPPLADTKVHSVTRQDRQNLIALMRALPLTVSDTKGDDWSIVSDGGIPLTEVDTRTMKSRIISNLYLTGDILHINRPSGGYSLQLCWTTGAVAGLNA
jgi:predicted Rossmann fold flavoprotein